MLDRINPTDTPAWKKLQNHFKTMKNRHMRDMFQKNQRRFLQFSLTWNDMTIDYSKNIISGRTLKLLQELAHECRVQGAIEKMFSGEKINATEGRAVLHVALRNRANTPVSVDGVDIMPEVNAVLEQMKNFSESLISGTWKGYTGKRITDIVNIGIGLPVDERHTIYLTGLARKFSHPSAVLPPMGECIQSSNYRMNFDRSSSALSLTNRTSGFDPGFSLTKHA
jgi:hypothetical protein